MALSESEQAISNRSGVNKLSIPIRESVGNALAFQTHLGNSAYAGFCSRVSSDASIIVNKPDSEYLYRCTQYPVEKPRDDQSFLVREDVISAVVGTEVQSQKKSKEVDLF